MKYYYLLFFILPILSCNINKDRYEKADTFELNDFQTTKELI